jgi:hypothetical protein
MSIGQRSAPKDDDDENGGTYERRTRMDRQAATGEAVAWSHYSREADRIAARDRGTAPITDEETHV